MLNVLKSKAPPVLGSFHKSREIKASAGTGRTPQFPNWTYICKSKIFPLKAARLVDTSTELEIGIPEYLPGPKAGCLITSSFREIRRLNWLTGEHIWAEQGGTGDKEWSLPTRQKLNPSVTDTQAAKHWQAKCFKTPDGSLRWGIMCRSMSDSVSPHWWRKGDPCTPVKHCAAMSS